MEQPDKEILKAISIKALAVPFSVGLTQAEREVIADHMIGVEEAIKEFRLSDFIGHGQHR